MINQKYILIMFVSILFSGTIFMYGYHKGTVNQIEKFEENRQELQSKILDLNEFLNSRNLEILKLNKEKKDLIYELENQALNAEGSSNSGVGTTGGLQRLERRWSSSPTSP